MAGRTLKRPTHRGGGIPSFFFPIKLKNLPFWGRLIRCGKVFLILLYLLHDGFEGLGVIYGQVGQYFTVYFDAGLVERSHELGVRQAFEPCGSVDALYPEGAEVTLLGAAVAVGVGETFLPSVLGYGPNVLAGTKVTAGKFQDALALSARGDVVY